MAVVDVEQLVNNFVNNYHHYLRNRPIIHVPVVWVVRMRRMIICVVNDERIEDYEIQ
jgi:hypothetical protein